MKTCLILILAVFSSCLSRSKKESEESVGLNKSTISVQSSQEKRLTECKFTVDQKIYFMNIYQNKYYPNLGSLYTINPNAPLERVFYSISFEKKEHIVQISFDENSEEMSLTINTKNWSGKLIEGQDQKENITNLECDEFEFEL